VPGELTGKRLFVFLSVLEKEIRLFLEMSYLRMSMGWKRKSLLAKFLQETQRENV